MWRATLAPQSALEHTSGWASYGLHHVLLQAVVSSAAAGSGNSGGLCTGMADVPHVAAGNGLGVSLGTGLAMAPSESSPLRLARYTVLSLAADFNSSSLPGQAVTLLQNSQESNAPLEPDTRLLVYRLAIAGGGSTVWNNLKQLYVQVSRIPGTGW